MRRIGREIYGKLGYQWRPSFSQFQRGSAERHECGLRKAFLAFPLMNYEGEDKSLNVGSRLPSYALVGELFRCVPAVDGWLTRDGHFSVRFVMTTRAWWTLAQQIPKEERKREFNYDISGSSFHLPKDCNMAWNPLCSFINCGHQRGEAFSEHHDLEFTTNPHLTY